MILYMLTECMGYLFVCVRESACMHKRERQSAHSHAHPLLYKQTEILHEHMSVSYTLLNQCLLLYLCVPPYSIRCLRVCSYVCVCLCLCFSGVLGQGGGCSQGCRKGLFIPGIIACLLFSLWAIQSRLGVAGRPVTPGPRCCWDFKAVGNHRLRNST